MSFENLFSQPIPLHEAAEFFTGLKKQAEWTDPPDMDGVLEGQFTVPVEQVLAKLKQIISMKFRLMVAYYTYAQCFRGPWWRAAKIEYYDHAEEEQEGAEFYLKRAVALGGPVHMDEIEPPPPSNNPLGISKMLMRAEQEMIAAQRELRTMVGDENPMKVGIEEHMLHDQHHLDETHQFLTQAEQHMVEAGAQVQGLPQEPPPAEEGMEPEELEPEEPEEDEDDEEEAPIEEKAASMRFEALLSKEAFLPEIAGLASGYSPGRNVAGETAAALAPEGRVTRSENIARQLAVAGAPAGGIGGLMLAKRLGGSEALGALAEKAGLPYEVGQYGAPLLAGVGGSMAGGALTGAGTGLVQRLRGPKKGGGKAKEEGEKEKESCGIKTSAAKEPLTDEELKETGRQRGVANLAAEATREKGRGGERLGKVLGMLGGGAGGGALGHHLLGGHPAGLIGGAALGGLAGRSAGSELGTELDIRRNAPTAVSTESLSPVLKTAAAAIRFDLALHKIAEGEDGAMGDMAAPTAGDLQPSNYLAAEIAGQQAQEANEANFYRQQLGQAQQTTAQMQQQMADVQAQLDQLQQQAAQSGEQVQQAAQEAMAARDDAVNATMEVAKARIGAQKMRQQMLELASQDPQALGEEAMAPQPMMGPDGQPMDPEGAPPGAEGQPGPEGGPPGAEAPDAGMQPAPPEEGPAGLAPPLATPPGAEPPAGAPDMNAPAGGPLGPQGEEAMPARELKTASAALLGGLGGAALGAGGSLMAGRNVGGLRDKVTALEGAQDGSFGHAAALAAAKQGLAAGELAEKHPVRSAIAGGLTGAMTGLAAGPALAAGGRELGGHLATIGRAAKRGMGG